MTWYVMRQKGKAVIAILGGFASREEAEAAKDKLYSLVAILCILERIPVENLGGEYYLEEKETEEETKLQPLFLKRKWEECVPIIIDLYSQSSS